MEVEQIISRPDGIRSLSIVRILNSPIDSNCYVVTKQNCEKCIIIDPAVENNNSLSGYLDDKKWIPEYIILTHEHFDHISSVNYLRDKYRCKVIASAECADNITDAKKNLSLFYDQVGFSCLPADIIVGDENLLMQWCDMTLNFFLTPGHSEGSLCFSIENNLFTGDTFMKKYKTVIKLPGGNRSKLEDSISKLLSVFDNQTNVFPGHGEVFILSETDKPDMIS